MRAFRVFAIACVMLLLLGCVGPSQPSGNETNESNYTAPPLPPVVTKPQVPPGYDLPGYCMQDADCVRQRKCCDCGMGEYVNIYNIEEPVCTGPSCACPIQLSEGRCTNNRCTAVPYEIPPENLTGAGNETGNGSTGFYFRAVAPGTCGNIIYPEKHVTRYGTFLNGSMNTTNPCYDIEAALTAGVNGTRILNLVSKPLVTAEECPDQCGGAVEWTADMSGFNKSVEVIYDGLKVYSDIDKFCGWGYHNCTVDEDCMRTGCFWEVCQNVYDPPLQTNCDDWRACYDDVAYGTQCGCISNRCGWRRVIQ